MKKEGLVILLLLMLVLPLCSAEMFVSQPKPVYNTADSFAFNITIIPAQNTNDFFIAKIVCTEGENSGETEIYRAPMSLKAGVQKSVDVSGRFDNFLVENLGGTCNLVVDCGDNGASSASFQMTKNVYVSLWTDKIIVGPSERINVSGKGIKGNGQLVTKGFVELRIIDLDITSFKAVDSGQFNIMLGLPINARAGDHEVSARVYEKDDDGEITNEGTGNTTIRIRQVIRGSDVAINEQKINPEEEFVYTIILYDQSDENVAANVEVSIYKPDGEVFVNKLVKSGEANSMPIESNFMPGTWRIESTIDNIQSNRTFYVEELERVDFKLINGTLIVANTGNVPYSKPVEVFIGDSTEVEDVYAGVGETRRYVLSAPDGEYDIGVRAGEQEQMLGTSFLTGRAIGVESEGSGGFWSKSSLLIWVMLISICALIAVQQYGRISKRAYYGETPAVSQYAAPIKLESVRAESTGNVITDGLREECAVVSLRIKNADDIDRAKGDAASAVERALTRARDARAKIYSDKNYKTMIFSPSMTNEKDNSLKAIEIAQEIESLLTEHNKRAGDKIMFGLGVHNGEMIVEKSGGDFKFNSIGNTMPYVKKIADVVSYGTGVSEMVHRRVLGKVKGDRVEGTNYWRIRKILNHGVHSEFINRFVERQRKETRDSAMKKK